MDYSRLPSAKLQTHLGHTVLDSRVITHNGAFRKVILWIPGHHDLEHAKFIHGFTGPETEIRIDLITPTTTFTVWPNLGWSKAA